MVRLFCLRAGLPGQPPLSPFKGEAPIAPWRLSGRNFIIEQARAHCHGNSGLRPRSQLSSQRDEDNQLQGYRFPSEIVQQADAEGEVLDVQVQSRRNKRAAESANRRS
jgi:hypothetical protein